MPCKFCKLTTCGCICGVTNKRSDLMGVVGVAFGAAETWTWCPSADVIVWICWAGKKFCNCCNVITCGCCCPVVAFCDCKCACWCWTCAACCWFCWACCAFCCAYKKNWNLVIEFDSGVEFFSKIYSLRCLAVKQPQSQRSTHCPVE